MFTLKTYNGQFPETNRIFILNKGNNSGKPSMMPFVNSFVLTASSEQEAQFYYFLCYALWKGKKFRRLLLGSVILFIRKNDLLSEICSYEKLLCQKADFANAVIKMIDLEKLLALKRKQLNRMEELKAAILINYIS